MSLGPVVVRSSGDGPSLASAGELEAGKQISQLFGLCRRASSISGKADALMIFGERESEKFSTKIDQICESADLSSVQAKFSDLSNVMSGFEKEMNRSEFNTTAPNCALKKNLEAAKTVVAQRYGNRQQSGSRCAMGVRLALEKSKVGDVFNGLGNAIDFLRLLPQHGYVDSGLRDLNQAPAGSILIFAGRHSDEYLANGTFSNAGGIGDWVGSITIKGDDGFYYSDGKIPTPAIGWEQDKNVMGARNIVAIMVPGPALVLQFVNQCRGN